MTHPRAAQTTSSRLRRLAPFLLLSLLSPGCGGGGGEPPPPVVHQSQAPSCADLVGDGDPRLLFSHRLIDPEAVSAAVVLGDMDPSSPQETLNFEQGMYVPVNTPLSAPTDIYVEAIVRSDHADVSDWGIAYHVCSVLGEDGVRRPGVHGNFAHVTTLPPTLQALFDAELAAFEGGLTSAVACSSGGCDLNLNRMRDNLGDPDYVLVVAAGASLGTAGPIDGVGPAGVDTNLLDRRMNDGAGNAYINPNRLGAEEGHGVGWRYGACFYEYFPAETRDAYLAKIRVLDEPRVSATTPCGTLDVDVANSPAGVWATSTIADQSMSADFDGAALDQYLGQVVVLADHYARPDTHMMISTSLPGLAQLGEAVYAMEFEKSAADSVDAEDYVNLDFAQAEAGPIHCYAGTRVGAVEAVYYLLQLAPDGDALTIERVETDCRATPAAERAFSEAGDGYVQLTR
ncbi:MAG: hypothetical protein R3B40_09780 [Polyangiales bacterium]|nr:hypothetical protein [Myxococcales bacterium]MCB9657868.1 hypothetical protein [Sandaracinaceae bacterium]